MSRYVQAIEGLSPESATIGSYDLDKMCFAAANGYDYPLPHYIEPVFADTRSESDQSTAHLSSSFNAAVAYLMGMRAEETYGGPKAIDIRMEVSGGQVCVEISSELEGCSLEVRESQPFLDASSIAVCITRGAFRLAHDIAGINARPSAEEAPAML